MAKATAVTEVTTVTLELTLKEAQAIRGIAFRTSGYDGPGGFRDCLNSINQTLTVAGVKDPGDFFEKCRRPCIRDMDEEEGFDQ